MKLPSENDKQQRDTRGDKQVVAPGQHCQKTNQRVLPKPANPFLDFLPPLMRLSNLLLMKRDLDRCKRKNREGI